ncbi:MAG: methyl-accepting chemotaxis protein [bacterium]
MTRPKDIYDLFSIWSPHKRISYAINGVIMGLGAPVGWLLILFFFFRPSGFSIGDFFVHEITHSQQQIFLYLYMTFGTSVVMSVTGYLVGRGFDWNEEKTDQLQRVQSQIQDQKKEFESRFNQLYRNMTNLYQIGTDIQRTLSKEHVLKLIAEGANRIMGFDRVNIFLVDKEKKALECKESRGHQGTAWRSILIPLSEQGGALIKTIRENEVYLVHDISTMSREFRLGSPFDRIPELRSRSFACIPIRERGQPIGLIAVDNKYRKSLIQDEDISTLQILADQGSIALTNISLFHGINGLHRELERNFKELLDRKDKFSAIVSELSGRAEEISSNIQLLAKNAEGLSETVNDTASSMHEMSGSLNEVAVGVRSLSEESEKTVSSTMEMNLSIREVESHAKESNSLSEQVKKEADEAVSLVQDSIRGIGKIQDIVMQSVEVMEKLGQRTEEINNFLEVINNINEKTNVLALNASIISAQAGEQGKSFAVVSSEIRALSEQTAASSKEIEHMIMSVQDEVRKAVSMIQSIPQHVEAGIQLSRLSGSAMDKILTRAVTSMEMTGKIEQATREQVKSTEVVSHAFNRVKEMIQHMTKSIGEQNQGSRVIAQANENMRKLTQAVAKSTVDQSEGFQTVARMVTQVSDMVDALFMEAEKRKLESELIIQGIDILEKKGPQG